MPCSITRAGSAGSAAWSPWVEWPGARPSRHQPVHQLALPLPGLPPSRPPFDAPRPVTPSSATPSPAIPSPVPIATRHDWSRAEIQALLELPLLELLWRAQAVHREANPG